jgi:uncharacterized membrane protein YebE (DUF533 family)
LGVRGLCIARMTSVARSHFLHPSQSTPPLRLSAMRFTAFEAVQMGQMNGMRTGGLAAMLVMRNTGKAFVLDLKATGGAEAGGLYSSGPPERVRARTAYRRERSASATSPASPRRRTGPAAGTGASSVARGEMRSSDV